MTTLTAAAPTDPALATDTPRTARMAGAAYLALAISGMIGFLALRPSLIDDNPADTLTRLTDDPGTLHLLVGVEMLIVISQAVAAVWFYRLLRPVRPAAAFAVAGFGLMNCVAIMSSAVALGTASALVDDQSLLGGADPAGALSVLARFSETAWGIGTIFFGLWLIPMGWAAVQSRRFPVVLGWLLIVGGSGYLLSGLADYSMADAPGWLVEGLAFPATVAEFWMVLYLLIRGIRPATSLTKGH